MRGSFAPVGKQLVQLDDSGGIESRSRHVHAEGHCEDCRAGRNVSCDVKCEHAPPSFAHRVLTRKEVQSKGIAVIPLGRIVLVECVILARRDVDNRGADGRMADKAKRAQD